MRDFALAKSWQSMSLLCGLPRFVALARNDNTDAQYDKDTNPQAVLFPLLNKKAQSQKKETRLKNSANLKDEVEIKDLSNSKDELEIKDLSNKNTNHETKINNLQSFIDKLVYSLYDLNENEIKIIESK
ncbi:hypothetical protein [Campylobacter troglodytis]|uniref:hypothetical protein n=1 Tax=Campylobacter troglodytis TaxID=654363 RepID=UPI001156D21A|nr:hypothetical protein [Campylobacter troglodytis]TQR54801.1 hypothetical protein DMC01_09940 [Campylobacter troglodytis]